MIPPLQERRVVPATGRCSADHGRVEPRAGLGVNTWAGRPTHGRMRRMCGRYQLNRPPAEIARWMGIRGGALPNVGPRYNIAPTQTAPVVRRHPDTGEQHLGFAPLLWTVRGWGSVVLGHGSGFVFDGREVGQVRVAPGGVVEPLDEGKHRHVAQPGNGRCGGPAARTRGWRRMPRPWRCRRRRRPIRWRDGRLPLCI